MKQKSLRSQYRFCALFEKNKFTYELQAFSSATMCQLVCHVSHLLLHFNVGCRRICRCKMDWAFYTNILTKISITVQADNPCMFVHSKRKYTKISAPPQPPPPPHIARSKSYENTEEKWFLNCVKTHEKIQKLCLRWSITLVLADHYCTRFFWKLFLSATFIVLVNQLS